MSKQRTTISGEEARDIIDSFRAEVGDQTRIEPLEAEFPYYAARLELAQVALLDLSDNHAGAFKWRGAMVGATRLSNRGIEMMIAPSAGNHARGAVLAAKALDMHLTVAVPSTAPPTKKTLIHTLWDSPSLEVRVEGDTFDETLSWAMQQPASLLHPYDNDDVIAGQGTVVDEVLTRHPDTQAIVLPVGGGGLVAGTLRRLDERGRQDIDVYAAQAAGSNSLEKSLSKGAVATADRPNQRYGGSAVERVGRHALDYARRYQNLHILTVPEADVDQLSEDYSDGRRELLRDTTPNFEPTTLVAVAALKQLRHLDAPIVVLGTGRNDTIYPTAPAPRYQVPC